MSDEVTTQIELVPADHPFMKRAIAQLERAHATALAMPPGDEREKRIALIEHCLAARRSQ